MIHVHVFQIQSYVIYIRPNVLKYICRSKSFRLKKPISRVASHSVSYSVTVVAHEKEEERENLRPEPAEGLKIRGGGGKYQHYKYNLSSLVLIGLELTDLPKSKNASLLPFPPQLVPSALCVIKLHIRTSIRHDHKDGHLACEKGCQLMVDLRLPQPTTYIHISMTSLLEHIVAQPTKCRFWLKKLNQQYNFLIGLDQVDKNKAQFYKQTISKMEIVKKVALPI